MSSATRAAFSTPLRFQVSDESDVSRVPIALDEVASRIASHPKLSKSLDVESEALDSLIERAQSLLPDSEVGRNVSVLVGQTVALVRFIENEARKVRYGGEEIDCSQVAGSIEDLADALDALEAALNE